MYSISFIIEELVTNTGRTDRTPQMSLTKERSCQVIDGSFKEPTTRWSHRGALQMRFCGISMGLGKRANSESFLAVDTDVVLISASFNRDTKTRMSSRSNHLLHCNWNLRSARLIRRRKLSCQEPLEYDRLMTFRLRGNI